MSTTQTTLGEPPRPDRSGPERDLVFTANGSTRASEVVFRSGALVGMESLNTRPPAHVPVEFVDWPFSKLDAVNVGELFDAHYRTVRGERPEYAVAPDIVGQITEVDALAWADELARYAETVIVVPKDSQPASVPRVYRVGLPCQPRYGPAPHRWLDYRECETVHLLGGSPTTHLEVMKYGIPVESVDTTAPLRAAAFGSYWTGEKWAQAPETSDFYTCLERSYSALRSSINPDRWRWSAHARNRQLDYEEWFWENHPDADLWHPDDNLPSVAYELREASG